MPKKICFLLFLGFLFVGQAAIAQLEDPYAYDEEGFVAEDREEAAGEEETNGQLFYKKDIPWIVGGLIIFVGGLGWAIWYINGKMSDSWDAAEAHEQVFEQELLKEAQQGEFIQPPETPAVDSPAPAAANNLPEFFASPTMQGSQAPLESLEATYASTAELVNALKRQNVIGDSIRREPLAAGLQGEAYQYLAGGSALILPHLESPSALKAFSKQYEVVFVLDAAGEVLCLTSLPRHLQPNRGS